MAPRQQIPKPVPLAMMMSESVDKENIPSNRPPRKAASKGSFGRLMSALTEEKDEQMAKELESKLVAEEKLEMEAERTRNETLSLMGAMKLDREMKDESYAMSLAHEEKVRLENERIVSCHAHGYTLRTRSILYPFPRAGARAGRGKVRAVR